MMASDPSAAPRLPPETGLDSELAARLGELTGTYGRDGTKHGKASSRP